MKQEKEKELWGNCDIEKDMSWNMYQILVNTAVSANLIGTICNFCMGRNYPPYSAEYAC